MAYQSVNPFDGKLLQTSAELSDTQLEAKIATATACFDSWRHRSYAERAVIVNKAAATMHDWVDELAHIVTPEMGKRSMRRVARCSSAQSDPGHPANELG